MNKPVPSPALLEFHAKNCADVEVFGAQCLHQLIEAIVQAKNNQH